MTIPGVLAGATVGNRWCGAIDPAIRAMPADALDARIRGSGDPASRR